MKRTVFVLGLSLGVASHTLAAQQQSMPNMPGMDMQKQQSAPPPNTPVPQHPQPNPKAKPGQAQPQSGPARDHARGHEEHGPGCG